MALACSIIVIAYLLGSIPVGYLMVRRATGADVRASGSGGTGATNVSRRAGKKAGVLTLVLDALKGVLAVLIARAMLASTSDVNLWVAAAGVAAIAGHIFPVWLRFRGGKGVATGLGVFAVLAPLATLAAVAVFLVVVWRTRYVSLGSIIAAATIPVAIALLTLFTRSGGAREMTNDDVLTPLLIASVVGSALIIFMHRANINRLLNGTENKLR